MGARLTKVFVTANSTWTAPAGVTEVLLIGCGGGGGGGTGTNSNNSDPGNVGTGGGGATQGHLYVTVTPGTSYSVTIGSGGAGGIAASTGSSIGSCGSATTFGSTLAQFLGASGGAGANTTISSVNTRASGGLPWCKGTASNTTNNLYDSTQIVLHTQQSSNADATITFGSTLIFQSGNTQTPGTGGAAPASLGSTTALNGDPGVSNWIGNGAYTGGSAGGLGPTSSGTNWGGGGGAGGGAGPLGGGGGGGGGGTGLNGSSVPLQNGGTGGASGGGASSAGGQGWPVKVSTTATATNGSAAVSGTFSPVPAVGDFVYFPSSTVSATGFQVSTSSGSSLTLATTFTGTTISGTACWDLGSTAQNGVALSNNSINFTNTGGAGGVGGNGGANTGAGGGGGGGSGLTTGQSAGGGGGGNGGSGYLYIIYVD